MKGKSTHPEIIHSHQPREKLPWEVLYATHEEEARYGDRDWEEEKRHFNSSYGHCPDPIDPPITLQLLVSTATALRPTYGKEKWVKTEQGPKRAAEVAAEEAYKLLFECAHLLKLADIKKTRLAALKEAYDSQVTRHQGKGPIKLNEGLQQITDRAHRQDAQDRFRAFLEVFYGEVLYCQGEAFLEPWMPHAFGIERGDFKAWARMVYGAYQERGFWEEEVVFFTKKVKELEKRGFLKKSTPRSLSRTKKKESKTRESCA